MSAIDTILKGVTRKDTVNRCLDALYFG